FHFFVIEHYPSQLCGTRLHFYHQTINSSFRFKTTTWTMFTSSPSSTLASLLVTVILLGPFLKQDTAIAYTPNKLLNQSDLNFKPDQEKTFNFETNSHSLHPRACQSNEDCLRTLTNLSCIKADPKSEGICQCWVGFEYVAEPL